MINFSQTLSLYHFFWRNSRFSFKKVNKLLSLKNSINKILIFRIIRNIPRSLIMKNVRVYKPRIFRYKALQPRFRTFWNFFKMKWFIRSARIQLLRVIYLKGRKTYLTNFIKPFKTISNYSTYLFFTKSSGYVLLNFTLLPQKTLFNLSENKLIFINLKPCQSFWYQLQTGDFVQLLWRFEFLWYQLKLKKRKRFFTKYFGWVVWLAIRHHIFNKFTAKTSFKRFWNMRFRKSSYDVNPVMFDYRSQTGVVLGLGSKKINQGWGNWYTFNTYNWKFSV